MQFIKITGMFKFRTVYLSIKFNLSISVIHIKEQNSDTFEIGSADVRTNAV